jgi:acyl-CoA synthetase (AMP-forming)/AMP-acid ligase II
MVGYLNAPSPFTDDGWYDTKDLVATKGDYIKIVGRRNELINVSGLKFMASDVERILMRYKDIIFVKVYAKNNPITGPALRGNGSNC